MSSKIFYVGTPDEVAHHAQPLNSYLKVEIATPEEVVNQATPDDLAIFFSEHFHRFRTSIQKLKELGCRTLYAIDGILEWRNSFETGSEHAACDWTMRPALSHKVAAIGRSQARQLSYWGNGEKLELIGIPRLDELVQKRQTNAKNGVERTPSDKKRCMVMTAKCPGFTSIQLAKVEQSLLDLKNWFDDHLEFEVIWRLTGELQNKLQIENSATNMNGAELAKQLQECDFLITTPSTAMLEGMLIGLPTAVLEYNLCPTLTDSVWSIRTEHQITEVIDELARPSESKLAHQEFLLHDALECDGKSTERLVELIEQMLKYPAHEIPSSLISTDRPELIGDANFAFLYNHHSLFANSDLHELQAYAAQLENEIEWLKKRNDQVENAFSDAKSTIDNVFENPFLSPFFKAADYAGKMFRKKSGEATANQPASQSNESKSTTTEN